MQFLSNALHRTAAVEGVIHTQHNSLLPLIKSRSDEVIFLFHSIFTYGSLTYGSSNHVSRGEHRLRAPRAQQQQPPRHIYFNLLLNQ